MGWNLQNTAQDELFAAIEGTAFHTRVILDRMAEYGTTDRARDQCGRDSAEQSGFESGVRERAGAACAGAEQESDEPGVRDLCVSGGRDIQDDRRGAEADLSVRTSCFHPQKEAQGIYDELYALYRRIYFEFGGAARGGSFGDVLPALIRISASQMSRTQTAEKVH